MCWTATRKSQILLCFPLQVLVFKIIEVFDFSIGHNGEIEIFEKKLLNQKVTTSKILNV